MPCDANNQNQWVISEQYLMLFPQTVLVTETELMGRGRVLAWDVDQLHRTH